LNYGIIVIPPDRESLLMANLLVRNLDDDVLKQLKAAAKANGRSLQAEIHEVLRNASARRLAETSRLSARWLKRLRGSTQTDSAALIREDRDTR
jgi:antitoxin FitA